MIKTHEGQFIDFIDRFITGFKLKCFLFKYGKKFKDHVVNKLTYKLMF